MKYAIKGWIALSVPDPEINDNHPRASFLMYEPSGEYNVPVREHTLEVDVDDAFDVRPVAVAAIDKEIEGLRAEMQVKITELLTRKSRLLALEMAK